MLATQELTVLTPRLSNIWPFEPKWLEPEWLRRLPSATPACSTASTPCYAFVGSFLVLATSPSAPETFNYTPWTLSYFCSSNCSSKSFQQPLEIFKFNHLRSACHRSPLIMSLVGFFLTHLQPQPCLESMESMCHRAQTPAHLLRQFHSAFLRTSCFLVLLPWLPPH